MRLPVALERLLDGEFRDALVWGHPGIGLEETREVEVQFRDEDWVRAGLVALGVAVDGERVDCDDLDRFSKALKTVLSPQALLFDMDGVLADVSSSYREAIMQTASHFGVQVSPHDISILKAAGGANNDWDVTRRLLAARGVDVPLQDVTARFETLYQGSEGVPGLRSSERLLLERAALGRLAARMPLAIVTGRPRRDAERFLLDAGIADLFAASICMEDGPLKPDPAPVRLAMRRLGVERAWMIGDTPDDVRAARAAGAVGLGIAAPGEDPGHAAEVLARAGAARVLRHLSELEEMLGS